MLVAAGCYEVSVPAVDIRADSLLCAFARPVREISGGCAVECPATRSVLPKMCTIHSALESLRE